MVVKHFSHTSDIDHLVEGSILQGQHFLFSLLTFLEQYVARGEGNKQPPIDYSLIFPTRLPPLRQGLT